MANTVEQEIIINAPIAKVWEVVTKPKHFSNWLGCKAEFTLTPGSKGKLAWENFGEAPLTIEAVNEPTLFSFKWISADDETRSIDGETLVTFTLSETSGGTKLRLVESGFDELDLTQEQKGTLRSKHIGGWSTFMAHAKTYTATL